MKITKKEYPKIVELMQRAYPNYKGRKFFLEVEPNEFDTTSYWDEGSRTYYKFVRYDGEVLNLPNTSPWNQQEENRKAKLIPGLVCIKETIFCGHLCGLTIMFHPEDVPKSIQNTVPHNYN